MAMAGRALLRSVATKMARAKPRLPYALEEHHGRLPSSSGGLWLSRFSPSRAYTPPPTNFRGPQTRNKKVDNELDWFKAGIKQAAPNAAFCLLLCSGFAFFHFTVNRKLDHMEAMLDSDTAAWKNLVQAIEKNSERAQTPLLVSNKQNQIEARDVVGEFSGNQ